MTYRRISGNRFLQLAGNTLVIHRDGKAIRSRQFDSPEQAEQAYEQGALPEPTMEHRVYRIYSELSGGPLDYTLEEFRRQVVLPDLSSLDPDDWSHYCLSDEQIALDADDKPGWELLGFGGEPADPVSFAFDVLAIRAVDEGNPWHMFFRKIK